MTAPSSVYRDVQQRPWFVWTSLVSVTCIVLGIYWDISWHMSIGRDTFWTPAHLMIQLGGIIGGVSGAALIFATTFAPSASLRDAAIRVWGFRGPLGAFLAAWGAATMIVSAPFDNWWHSAYGLDVKILSPPHVVLLLGMLGVASGGLVIVLAATNRASSETRGALDWFVLVIGGEILLLTLVMIAEHTIRPNLHSGDAYRTVAIVVPPVMLAVAGISDQKWAATIVAGMYTAVMIAGVWVMPLFAAEPKLGPVYQHVTHYIPLDFPVLIIVPALAIDLLRERMREMPAWRAAPVIGITFVTLLLAAQWPFATFLQSEGSRNWIFGTSYFPYFDHPEWYAPRHVFMPQTALANGLIQAALAAVVSSWVGLVAGRALRKVKR
jgi:hypothetical protein